MSVAQTRAAQIMQERSSELTAHQVISLLFDGALERVQQAKNCAISGNEEDKKVLIDKLVAIINGLRSSLNFEDGGDIALNLDCLYDYMVNKLGESEEEVSTLTEVAGLIARVKSGWDAIDPCSGQAA
ncbi:flagellar export chaperone FliS [Teredinibacter sp. KSP-S5-2]|uniref:flagellar export chaperone FliS n=1 Tax=Teredinibacter sp. KSP-S5-2 TaxID=3034506 RepID=UPI002934F419|nr:flagellar export chaperone FliS [Teredinibacter sp. KSP-S5-2]WNO07941.1 flagellar export chaperone FliS [Teredinibacter sp. KSP-S5-2]